jgi:hypothetical protein
MFTGAELWVVSQADPADALGGGTAEGIGNRSRRRHVRF